MIGIRSGDAMYVRHSVLQDWVLEADATVAALVVVPVSAGVVGTTSSFPVPSDTAPAPGIHDTVMASPRNGINILPIAEAIVVTWFQNLNEEDVK